MKMQQNHFDEYIKSYPRESLQLTLMVAGLIWFTPVGVLSIIIFGVLKKKARQNGGVSWAREY